MGSLLISTDIEAMGINGTQNQKLAVGTVGCIDVTRLKYYPGTYSGLVRFNKQLDTAYAPSARATER